MLKLLKLSFFLGLFLCLSGCTESPYVEFYSYHELMEYDFFSHCWFPGILKEDAFGIKETYDVTSRHAFGKFEFKQRDLYEPDFKTCRSVPADSLLSKIEEIERPSFPKWFIPKGNIEKSRYLIVKDKDFFLIVEKDTNCIYFLR